MLSSKSFVLCYFICCLTARNAMADYEKKKVGVIEDDCVRYNLFLSFKAQARSKSFVNNTKRRLVFWNPEETTIELEAGKTKKAPWAFKLKREVYLSYRNGGHETHSSLPRLNPDIFLAEGIYTFCEEELGK